MAFNDQNIFIGGGEISIYDATNGWQYMGYTQDISVNQKSINHKIIDGNLRQYSLDTEFEFNIYDASQNMIDELESRKDTKQNVYVVGTNNMLEIHNVYLNYGTERPFSYSDPQILKIQGATCVSDDVKHYYNLLGVTGSFENDDNSDGLADGWTFDGVGFDIIRTFFTAATSDNATCQTCLYEAYTLSSTKTVPFKNPKKVTFSVWVRNSGSVPITNCTFRLTGALLNLSGSTVVSANTTVTSFARDSASQQRMTVSVNSPRDTFIASTKMLLYGEPDIGSIEISCDNAQIEFGDLSAFKNY